MCQQHNLLETFTVERSDQNSAGKSGVEHLLNSIPVRLKTARLRTLGIVLDADVDVQTCWQAVRGRLPQAGYNNLPESPVVDGTILIQDGKPKVGIWLMPDNQLVRAVISPVRST